MTNLLEQATQAGKFKTLLSAVNQTGLDEMLSGSNFLTLLAPTDEAFSKLDAGVLDALLTDAPRLKRVVTYHLLFGDVRSDDLQQIAEAETVEGSIVAIEHGDGIEINEAHVTQTDILADNGVIHVIDRVLMPALMVGHS